MNSQELFTIDEATGEIIPVVTQPPSHKVEQQSQNVASNIPQRPLTSQQPGTFQQNSRQIQSQPPNQFRNNQVPIKQNQSTRPQFQSPVSVPPQQQTQAQLQPQYQSQLPPQPPVQQSVPYKNWKNTNMNNFRMIQPSNIVQPTQQPVFNQFIQQPQNTNYNNVDNTQSQEIFQFDENQLYEQQPPPQQSNRLKHGSFISKTNVQSNYNITSLPRQGSLAIRKARTGKNSEDIYL